VAKKKLFLIFCFENKKKLIEYWLLLFMGNPFALYISCDAF
jgi:hypothetical protein